MNTIQSILDLDKRIFIYLNNLGSIKWDGFWLAITNQFYWIPFFALLLYFVFKVYGLKKTLIILLITAVLVTFTDQFVNLIKHTVQRVRPNNDPSVNKLIRILIHPHSFSFVSGHATNSFANTTFLYLLLRKKIKYIFLIFSWPIIFTYSRIYVGVHYPIDLITGMMIGITLGIIFYKITLYILKKVN